MIIERIALRGIARFNEEVALDLRTLPAGRVAIVGENGEGKTFLLETPVATLLREFLSRDQKDIVAYATGPDSYTAVDFVQEGQGSYQARVNLDGTKRTSDAVLSLNGQELSDGKVSTYDAAIAERFPSKSALLASVCSPQNRNGNFIGLKPKAAKQLFGELLGHQHYAAISATATQAVKLLEQSLKRLDVAQRVLLVETSTERRAALDARERDAQATIETAQAAQDDADMQIDVLDGRLALVAEQAAAFAAATQRADAMRADLVTRGTELGVARSSLAAVDTSLQAELTRIATTAIRRRNEIGSARTLSATRRDSALAEIAHKAEVARKDIDGRIANNKKALDDGPAVRAAVEQVTALDAIISDTRRALDASTIKQAEIQQQLRALEADRAALDADDIELRRLKADADTIATVPCDGATPFATCRFLTTAIAARERIPALEQRVASRGATIHAIEQAMTQQTALGTSIADARRLIERTERDRSDAHKLAAKIDVVASAEARIAELERQRVGVDTQEPLDIASAKAAWMDRDHDLVKQLAAAEDEEGVSRQTAQANADERRAELTSRINAIDAALQRIQSDLRAVDADVASTIADATLAKTIQDDIAAWRQKRDAALSTLARAESALSGVAGERAILATRQAALDALQADMARLGADLVEYQQLAKFTSPDGLPTLEIDEAGPTVSSYANALLEACDLPRFTVELVTQEERADKKALKESFTVKVYDNVRGGEPRDVSDLSGGEQIIVSEALMNAIALYVNAKSVQPIRTCWRDETTGALDPENAVRYMRMLQKVQELGGFHHIFFITHNAEAAAMADAQIRVAGGRADIVLPPYGRQEAA